IYTYYVDNRLKETIVRGLTTGSSDIDGLYHLTPGIVNGQPNAAAEIRTLTEYDAAGNVVRQYDGRGNFTQFWYDKLGRQVAKVDPERYVTVWERDAEGNATSEVRYATAISTNIPAFSSTTPFDEIRSSVEVDDARDRKTQFVYDKLGRRIEERRLGVAYTIVAIDGSAVDTSGTAIIRYSYNGLGQVESKTEATGDRTRYEYDSLGRLTLEEGQAFVPQPGADPVIPRTRFAYDGLNNLQFTRTQAGASEDDTKDRIIAYTYDSAGRMASMTVGENFRAQPNPEEFTRYYGYDAAGRTVRESYVRTNSSGNSIAEEAVVTLYDLAGHVTTKTNARKNSSGAWVYSISDAQPAEYYEAVRMRYNAYGDMTERGMT
ncbi:MAG: RHS repeat protein, partial [Alphaproteobacteria bacterium]